jgi:RNA polymerase sigma factor (sigma-70 family)
VSEPNPRIRKGISALGFERLLQLLDPEPNRAGQKYEDLRWMLIHFFELNHCASAEDLADETLNRVTLKLETEVIGNVRAFACGVARNIKLEARTKAQRFVAISDLADEGSSLTDGRDLEKEIHMRANQERQLVCLDSCLQRLPKRERELFLAYYNPVDHSAVTRQKLAAELGVTEGALKIRMIRLRYKLRKCTERYASSALHRPGPVRNDSTGE